MERRAKFATGSFREIFVTIGWVRCSIAALAAVSAVVVASPDALAQATPIQITVGESRTLELNGNPSTGHTWVVHDASGTDGQVVAVDVKGYRPGAPVAPGERPKLGAPAKFLVLLTGVAAGRVSLTFDYVRGGTPAPASSQTFAVEVLDAAPKQPADEPEVDAIDDPTSDKPAESNEDLFADPEGTDDGGGNDDPN